MHADFLRGAHAPRVQCSAPSRNTPELARRNAFDLSPVRLTSDFRFQLSTCSQPLMDTDRHGFNPPPGLQTFDFCPAPFGFRLRPLAFSLRIVGPGKPVHGTEAIPTTTGRARRLRTGRRPLSESAPSYRVKRTTALGSARQNLPSAYRFSFRCVHNSFICWAVSVNSLVFSRTRTFGTSQSMSRPDHHETVTTKAAAATDVVTG